MDAVEVGGHGRKLRLEEAAIALVITNAMELKSCGDSTLRGA